MVIGHMPFKVAKSEKSKDSKVNRENFVKRISQGLTEENRNDMDIISDDCRKLLENLLQPNKFKRLQIKEAIFHPWFQRDDDLKRALPQHRLDLKQKLEPEIIDVMADKLCVSVKRIQNHLVAFRFETISAMFYMLQDTLIKEVLYPPKDLENSLIYKLECRRKANACSDPNLTEEDEDESEVGRENSQSFDMNETSFLPVKESRVFNPRTREISDIFKNRKISNNSQNFAEIRKRIGDGDHDDQLSKATTNNELRLKPNYSHIKDECRIVSIKPALRDPIPICNGRLMTEKPFRSYKSNRPSREAYPVVGNVVKEVPRNTRNCETSMENNKYFDINENQNSTSSCSVYLNHQRNVKLLNDKFNLKCQISTPKSTNIKTKENRRTEINSSNFRNSGTTAEVFCPKGPRKLFSNKVILDTAQSENGHNTSRHPSRKPVTRTNPSEHLNEFRHRSLAQTKNTPQNVYSGKNFPMQSTTKDQQCRERYITNKRSGNISNPAYTSNIIQVNSFQCGLPPAVMQRPAFSVYTRKPKVSWNSLEPYRWNSTIPHTNSNSQIQVEVPQKTAFAERVEGIKR